MKKGLKYTLYAIGLLIIGVAIYLYFKSESLPEKTIAGDADLVAEKILDAVHKDAWDTTKFVTWSFRDNHHYVWNKNQHFVEVRWDDIQVLLDTKEVKGIVYQGEEKLEAEEAEELVKKAWAYFCNDSWWLNAPVKLFDVGTERTLVELEDGREGLKVQYITGGVTPGDTYVWLYDENYLPTSYKMWVSIIPVGGVESSWENYKELPSGAIIAQTHKMAAGSLEITNINSAQNLKDLDKDANLFEELSNLN